MITPDQFDRVYKSSTYRYDGYAWIAYRLDITGREMVEFVERQGYTVIAHTALGKVTHYGYNAGGGTDNAIHVYDYIEKIIALKEGEIPPEKWENGRYVFPDIMTTFFDLMKKKLLAL